MLLLPKPVFAAQRQIPYGPRSEKCDFLPKSVSVKQPYLGATGSFGPKYFFSATPGAVRR